MNKILSSAIISHILKLSGIMTLIVLAISLTGCS